MTTITVTIENNEDISALQETLDRLAMAYSIDDDDEALEASLKRAEEDSKAGRVRPHSEVWPEIKAHHNFGLNI